MAQKKKYTNLTGQVLRFSEDGRDHAVAPGHTFTAAPTPYTEGLVARGMASAKDVDPEPTPEQAAGPTAAASIQKPATTAPPAVARKAGK